MSHAAALYGEPEATALIATASAALQAGQTLLYPTDTIWGLGCAANQPDAVARLYRLKQRDPSKSMLVLLARGLADEVARAVRDDSLRTTLRDLLASRRPTTVVCPPGLGPTELLLHSGVLCPSLLAADGSIGIRVPANDFLQRLLATCGTPLVSTSANLSGRPSPHSRADIEAELLARTDCVLPPTALDAHPAATPSEPSRIVRLTPDGVDILRP